MIHVQVNVRILVSKDTVHCFVIYISTIFDQIDCHVSTFEVRLLRKYLIVLFGDGCATCSRIHLLIEMTHPESLVDTFKYNFDIDCESVRLKLWVKWLVVGVESVLLVRIRNIRIEHYHEFAKVLAHCNNISENKIDTWDAFIHVDC